MPATVVNTSPANEASGSVLETRIHFGVLDSWRGVAALLVALFHLNILSSIYSLHFIRNSYLFVDFFFVLSGFVISHSYGHRLGTLEGVGRFVMRRLGRLWPLHAVVLIAFIVVEGGRAISTARGASFVNPPFTGATSFHSILTNLLFGQSLGIEQQLTWNPPSWSICAEFWTYLIFASAVLAGATWLRRISFATEYLLGALMAGSACILVLFARHGIDATYDLGFVRCIYGFMVGHLTYRLWQATSGVRFKTGFLEVAVVIAVAIYVSLAGRTGYSFLAPLVFAAVVFVFAFEAGPISGLMLNRGSVWLGRISYSIYMWQAFIIFNFIDRAVAVLEKVTGQTFTTTAPVDAATGIDAGKLIAFGGQVAPILATLFFVALVIAVASASYYLIEQPGQRLFGRLAHGLRRQVVDRTNLFGEPVLLAGTLVPPLSPESPGSFVLNQDSRPVEPVELVNS
jgi:peptidoglycan/LPS O-acetylase OafA/YrhL